MAHSGAPLGTGKNWVSDAGGFPSDFREMVRAIMDGGKTESNAIQIAWGVLRNWATGRGQVTAATRAKAVRLLAELDALRARAHATPDLSHSDTDRKVLDMAMPPALAKALAVRNAGTVGPAVAAAAPPKMSRKAQAIHDKLVAKGVKPHVARKLAVRAASRAAPSVSMSTAPAGVDLTVPAVRFPITTRAELRAAIEAFGHTRPEDQPRVSRYVVAHARELGAVDMLTSALSVVIG